MSNGLRRAALSTGGAQYVIYALSFIRLIVISRVLTSAEIGAFVLASSLVLLASVPRVFGTMDYIVALPEVTRAAVRTCFTILLVMGAVMGVLYLLGAPYVAGFYGDPVITDLLRLMALSFLVLPFGLLGQAALKRQMRFGRLALARVGGAVVETAVTLGLIVMGYGVIGMAWGFFAANVTVTLTVIALVPSQVIFRPGIARLGEILRFGALSSAGAFLNRFGDLGPPLLLGRTMDASNVGLFSRGQTLINFFRQGVETAMAPVVQPWFANHARNDPSLLGGGFARIMGLVSVVTWPFYAFVFLHAGALIPLLLGPGWERSIPVAQALATGGLFSPYLRYADSLLIGLGRVRARLKMTALAQALRFGLLGVALAAGLGLNGFAWALAAGHLAGFVLALVFLVREIGLAPRRLFSGLSGPVWIAAAVLALNAGLIAWLGAGGSAVIVGAGATALLWGVMLVVLDHPLLGELRDLWLRLN